MTIDASMNEIETLAQRAARGAGLAWGLAEEVGKGAGFLARAGLPWAETLLALAAAHAQGTVPRPQGDGRTPARLAAEDGGPLSPVLAGAALADGALGPQADTTVTVAAVPAPLWLVPFAARRAEAAGGTALIAWPGVRIAAGAGGVRVLEGGTAALAASGPADVTVTSAAARDDLGFPSPRAHVTREAWTALDRLGARTYVPASTHSRLAGAGAGMTDND